MLNHPVWLKVSKLDRKSFEGVALRYVVLDSVLKLFRCEWTSTHTLVLIVRKRCWEQIAKLVVPLCWKIVVVLSDRANLVLQDILKLFLLLRYVWMCGSHDVSDAVARRKRLDVALRHAFPHVLIFEVPTCIDYPVICLYVSKESLVVKCTTHCSIEAMNAGILGIHLLTSQAFPKVALLFSLCARWRSSEDPSVWAFTVCSNNDISIKSESQQ